MKESEDRTPYRLLLALGLLALLCLYLGYELGKTLALSDNQADACAAAREACGDPAKQ